MSAPEESSGVKQVFSILELTLWLFPPQHPPGAPVKCGIPGLAQKQNLHFKEAHWCSVCRFRLGVTQGLGGESGEGTLGLHCLHPEAMPSNLLVLPWPSLCRMNFILGAALDSVVFPHSSLVFQVIDLSPKVLLFCAAGPQPGPQMPTCSVSSAGSPPSGSPQDGPSEWPWLAEVWAPAPEHEAPSLPDWPSPCCPC